MDEQRALLSGRGVLASFSINVQTGGPLGARLLNPLLGETFFIGGFILPID